MSISTEIQRLQNAKASIKTSIESKGVTVPSATKLDGYSTLIDSIQTGITPTGTISITSNGTVDVANYASADVNVSGGASALDALIDRSLAGALTTNATEIGNSALRGCNRITSLSAPQATKINDSGCKECTALTSISFDSLTSYGGTGHFQTCTSLTNVYMPLIEQLPLFSGCTSLAFFDAPSCTKINTRTFYDCKALAEIVLRKNSVVTLNNVDAFTNTPFRGYNGLTGVVYVPSSLISSYQTATNWSTMYSAGYCTFSAIEGSAYE